MTESALLRAVRLAAQRLQPRIRLYRNNCGIALYPDGSRVAYGLTPGSADLIGWLPVVVTPEMVGSTVGIFVTIECKTKRGRLTAEQASWAEAARAAGCLVRVVRAVEELEL